MINRPKSDLERLGSCLLCVAGATLALVAICAAIINGPKALAASEGDSVDQLERRIVDLERALAMYTDAGAVIVIRDDGECGLRWWEAGKKLGCGTAWCRYRVPIEGGNAVVTFDAVEVPK